MKFTISAAALLAFVSSALAQATEGFDAITSPTEDEVLTAGTTFTITWDPTAAYDDETVSIILLQGATQGTLELGPTVASSIDSSLGTYSWTVDSSNVGYALYGLKLQLDSDNSIFQYSFPFQIEGSTSSTSSSIPVTTSTPASSVSLPVSSSVTSLTLTSTTTAVTTIVSPSVTSAVTGFSNSTTSSASASGTGIGKVTTLTTVSKASATGAAAAASTSAFATAGAGKVAAAGTFAAIGGMVAAVLAL